MNDLSKLAILSLTVFFDTIAFLFVTSILLLTKKKLGSDKRSMLRNVFLTTLVVFWFVNTWLGLFIFSMNINTSMFGHFAGEYFVFRMLESAIFLFVIFRFANRTFRDFTKDKDRAGMDGE